MSCTTISENLAGLRAEIANAEATQNEVVSIMGRRETVPAELWQRLLATSPGVSLEDIQAKVNRQMADAEDVKALRASAEVVAGPLRDAQRAANDVAGQLDFAGMIYRNIGSRISEAIGEAQQSARARVGDLWAEVGRLRSAPNKNEIAGRERHISELKAQLDSASAGARETPDGHTYNSALHTISVLKKRLAADVAAPFEFSSEAVIPPELAPFDLAATVIAIVVDELGRALTDEQKNRLADAFRLMSPAGMKQEFADMRRTLADLDARAKAVGEQEEANQVK